MEVEKIRKPIKGLSIDKDEQDVDFIYEYPRIEYPHIILLNQ